MIQQFIKPCTLIRLFVIPAIFNLAAHVAVAQVKIGTNPTTISTNAVLDVEGNTGSHTVVLQNGNTGVGTVTPANKLEINSGSTNSSGLRLTNLTSVSPKTQANVSPIGVDNNGDVVTVNSSASHSFLYDRGVTNYNSYSVLIQTTTGGTGNLIPNQLVYDPSSMYNPTTGQATVPVSGLYQVSAKLIVQCNTLSNFRVDYFRIRGATTTLVASDYTLVASTPTTLNGFQYLPLQAGDKVYIGYGANAGSFDNLYYFSLGMTLVHQ
ncbi:hypothetical protein DSL64_26740 [Dyadobacter luteus]|uniref:C1q domain-containing protein n=1 Tax=Dyadobacter luteus TaxID=2259619 RepID=A0A3D8Y3C0_9BACT|nr:hypothetical protein [Dyadobacter luteus]REA56518.1 hypothetical protein DSL64_26740 [Dyadobacter luteus]